MLDANAHMQICTNAPFFCSWIFSSLPANKQMLALSATYPESLAQYLARYMREPTFVRLNPSDPGLKGNSYSTVKGVPIEMN